MKKTTLILVSLLMSVAGIFYADNARALTDIMCSEDEKCVACREDIDCQECYFKCANKHGEITSDPNFLYRLSEGELRALQCYKGCWDEEVDITLGELKPTHSGKKSFHKKRD